MSWIDGPCKMGATLCAIENGQIVPAPDNYGDGDPLAGTYAPISFMEEVEPFTLQKDWPQPEPRPGA